MRFDDLDCCPFCGYGVFHERQQVRGSITYRMNFDVDERYEADNTDMYNYLDVQQSGRAYCDCCERYIGNYITGTIGKEAEREIKKQNNCRIVSTERNYELSHTTVPETLYER